MALNGTWQDQHGNVLRLVDGNDGTISGTYANASLVGTYSLAGSGIPLPLGWSYSVGLANVTFCGYLNGNGTMLMIFVSAQPGVPPSTGTDTFVQV